MATVREIKTVFKYIVDESNRKQRELIGLNKEKNDSIYQ